MGDGWPVAHVSGGRDSHTGSHLLTLVLEHCNQTGLVSNVAMWKGQFPALSCDSTSSCSLCLW